MLNLPMSWRTTLWIGFHVFLIVGSFLPQTGGLLLVSWWAEQQDVGHTPRHVTRQPVPCPRWWPCVQRVYHGGKAVVALSLSLWFLGDLVSRLEASAWAGCAWLSSRTWRLAQVARCYLV